MKYWIRNVRPPIDVLALQEVKADEFRLNIALRAILPGFQYFTSAPEVGKGGTAPLISPLLKVVASG